MNPTAAKKKWNIFEMLKVAQAVLKETMKELVLHDFALSLKIEDGVNVFYCADTTVPDPDEGSDLPCEMEGQALMKQVSHEHQTGELSGKHFKFEEMTGVKLDVRAEIHVLLPYGVRDDDLVLLIKQSARKTLIETLSQYTS
jgi:hypothetical protein